MKRIIAVDFDGTLCCSDYPEANAQNWLNRLILRYIKRRQRKGDIIILWTCRTDDVDGDNGEGTCIYPNSLGTALTFLYNRGFAPNLVNKNYSGRTVMFGGDSRKVSSDIMIDDKNFGLFGWFMRRVDAWSKRELQINLNGLHLVLEMAEYTFMILLWWVASLFRRKV